jgi:hypothetical protein
MTGTVDVEDVISKLNNVEKVSLLAGKNAREKLYICHGTDRTQVPIGGIQSQ